MVLKLFIKMDKEKFVFYFKKRRMATSDKSNDVEITNVVKSATQDVTKGELKIVAKEIEASRSQRDHYQKTIPSTIKSEVGSYALVNGTAAAIKRFSLKYTKYTFNRTTVNSWKNKCKPGDLKTFRTAGRPNLLDETLLKKVKTLQLAREQREV